MSRRRRRRGRAPNDNQGGANKGGANRRNRAKGGKGGPKGASNREKTRERSQGRGQDGPGFWGDPSQLPEARTDVAITDDPHAVPRSLGEPPLPQQRQIAEHYFAAIYERAVATAGALAAAGGLIPMEELTDDEA